MPRDHPDWITEQRRELGERIADLRTAAHYTQLSFSEATGISRSTLQRIESGEGDPRYSELLRIAAVLDKDVSVLTTGPAKDPAHPPRGKRTDGAV